jgi:transposase InsO family protein
VHHSDRGAAYTSLAFSQRVRELELDQFFGSTGDCYDNAAVEAFWATLKRELGWIHNTTTWPNRAELRSARFDYIEGFYNPNRTSTPARPSKPRRLRTTLSRLNTVSTKAGQLQQVSTHISALPRAR